MKLSYRWLLPALFAASVSAVVLAQPPALDVKMGLWEITSVSDIGGQMPAIDTSKMTPEQKAKMDAAIKAMAGTHTNVAKTCMTKEKFNKSNFMMEDEEPGTVCKQTITTNTRATLEGTVACTGERVSSGQMHIDALSPTAFKGSIKLSNTEQGRAMTINTAMSGKWLGADCGSEK